MTKQGDVLERSAAGAEAAGVYLAVENAGLDAHHGVHITPLGLDDGGDGRWAAFTHDEGRALAAVAAEVHELWGENAGTIEVERVEWWRLRGNCGCGERCRHDAGNCLSAGTCSALVRPCGRAPWIAEPCVEGAPGAVPVIVAGALL